MLRYSLLILSTLLLTTAKGQIDVVQFEPPRDMLGTPAKVYPDKFETIPGYPIEKKLASYKTIQLSADISHLSDTERLALNYLIEAANYADKIFWLQSYGEKDSVMKRANDENVRKFLMLNYGPWDRLDDNKPFIQGIGPKPPGAGFYPEDLTKAQYDSLFGHVLVDPYSVMVRNPVGLLEPRPYFMIYSKETHGIVDNLFKAAALLKHTDRELSEFIRLRAEAFMMNRYEESDIAWLKLKKSNIDIIIGPIETYEDKLAGIRPAYESYILIRDKTWGAKLEKFIGFLPDLQSQLPVDSVYKTEKVNNALSQLAVFEAVYYAGDCNAGSKTIAVNLPNDEKIQTQYGTRRSQIKNVMRAKFDNMVLPISQMMIDVSQRGKVNFDAFFNNVMFHEIAHGLGIKNTINGKGTISSALGANHGAIEECKADVLGLFMVTKMVEKGELPGALEEYYVTFTASIFRSVRFGAGNDHGKANMITFNTLLATGAIEKQSNGTYKVNVASMKKAIEKLAGDLLKLQGDGDAEAVKTYVAKMAVIPADLTKDLERINKAGIPVDLVFEQGPAVLGLK